MIRTSPIVFVFLLLHGFSTAAESVTVTLKSEASSSAEQVLLGEIADIAPQDEKLSAVTIGRAAIAGQSRTVASTDVLLAIRKALGTHVEVQQRGPLESRVTAASQTVTSNELTEAAGLILQNELQKDPDIEAQVQAATPTPELVIRPGAYQLQCDLPEGGVHPGVQTVHVHVIQNGKHAAESTCSMCSHVTCPIAIAIERLAAGELLEATSYKIVRREVTAAELKERCNAEKLCGLRSKQSIAADQMLTKSQFAQPLSIRRGEAVRIVVRRGVLELTAVGQARNDASIDDPVRIFISDSGAEVMARTSGLREATLDDPLAGNRDGRTTK